MYKPLLDKLTTLIPETSSTCLKNISILMCALLIQKTTCLYRLKTTVGAITGKSSVSAGAHYKRLIRIFDDYSDQELWLKLVKASFSILRLKSKYLLLDGTSWERGTQRHHYITLCLVYQGVAIPLIWANLEKKGCSSFEERKKLFDLAMEHFNLEGLTLLADREYNGIEWFKYLSTNDIPFIIRSKINTYYGEMDADQSLGIEKMIDKVLRSKVPGKRLCKSFDLDGVKVWITVAKNPDQNAKEAFMLLLSSINPTRTDCVYLYLKRWKIEHCFKHLKSNGFDLEALNLKTEERRTLLLSVIVFAYTCSVVEGLKEYKKIKYKHYANGTSYKAESVFTHGIAKIQRYTSSFSKFLKHLIRLLSPPKNQYKSATILRNV